MIRLEVPAEQVRPGDHLLEQRHPQLVVHVDRERSPNGTSVVGLQCRGNNSPYWYVASSLVRIERSS